MADYDSKTIQRTLEKRLHDFDLAEHKNLKTKRATNTDKEWFYFALSYIKASKTLLEKAKSGNDLDAKMHIIPGLYNFRHSIELSLKFLNKLAGVDFPKDHDLIKLYDSMFKTLKVNSYKQIKDFMGSKEDKNGSSEDNLKKIINEEIDNLSCIVNKYYFQTPLQKSLKPDTFFIEDRDNEVFKYPEARNIVFYYQSVRVVNLPPTEIQLVILDIDKMMTTLSLFFSLFNPQKERTKDNVQ